MEGTIRLYLENRMRELGFGKFFMELKKITLTAGVLATYDINAHNEYWYLFDVSQDTDDFTITAANRIITKDDFYADGVPYLTFEFTGDINIDNSGATLDQTFVFYRVIPE